MSLFKIGQKIVCVDDSKQFGAKYGYTKVIEGEIYTIRDFNIRDSILLVEIVHKPSRCIGGFYESGYGKFRFRPIDFRFGKTVAEEIEQEINEEHLVHYE